MGVALVALCACSTGTFGTGHAALPNVAHLRDVALTWHAPGGRADGLFGARLLYDGGPVPNVTLAITRAILRANQQIAAIDALRFAELTVRAARRNGLPAEFLGATLLQESAFDPRALSSAGAVGVGQFELGTAAAVGVDPFDPIASIAAAGDLLGRYADAYAGRANPLDLALAAYNAGPGAVAAYRGVPPYPETRAYIADIDDREGRIYSYETPRKARAGERGQRGVTLRVL